MLKKWVRFLSVVTLGVSITACHNVPVWRYGMFERPPGGGEYNPNYVKGWKDGCESGAQASANSLYRFVYSYKQDWRMLSDPYYSVGWQDSYNFCRKYVLQYNLDTMR